MGEDWTQELFRSDDQVSGTHQCVFSEYDKHGDTQECWFKPNPLTCFICLLGQQAEHLSMIDSELKEIRELLAKGRRF